KEKILKAFSSRFGQEEAEAIYLAIRSSMTGNSRMIGSYGLILMKEKPEICLKALTYSKNYYPKMMLLLSAMNQIVPKEALNLKNFINTLFSQKQYQELTHQVMKIMDEEIIPNNSQLPEKNPYILALAFASGYDEKYFSLFEKEIYNRRSIIAEWVMKSEIDKERVLDVIERCETPSLKYISLIANAYTEGQMYWHTVLPTRDAHLKKLAQKFSSEYKQQMYAEKDIEAAKNMEKIFKKVYPDYDGQNTLRDKARRGCADILTENNPDKKYEIEKFLSGSLSTEEFVKLLPEIKSSQVAYYGAGSQRYISAYGLDDFAERCICYRVMKDFEFYRPLSSLPGFEIKNQEEKLVDILQKHQVPMPYLLNGIFKMLDSYDKKSKPKILKRLSKCSDEIAQMDVKDLNVEARNARVQILGNTHPKKYNAELFAAAKDSSKLVRNTALEFLPVPTEALNSDILALLNGKKISEREVAVALLEKNLPECYKEAVQKAFESEKTEKLKNRLAILLNGDGSEISKQSTSANIIDEYSKGNKARKVTWLFETPFTSVHDKDGNEVEEKYLVALTNMYASMDIAKLARNEIADQLAESLNQTELERFAQEVFSRFIDKGAEAKQRWVIYFTAIYGGFDAVTSLQHYIKEWAEHSRGAIASDAVKALALNGSSVALMAVDQMARKFKHRQVRNTAGTALYEAAKALNITREELEDRIIPDLGFDETLCRIFDYGARQFQVYLT
ncbi:MAG: hypothetical protein IKP69_02330, partial [Oscillospiraceae bacterium]|nr:hypothetical protein [Oscillospiraceae bacterium]